MTDVFKDVLDFQKAFELIINEKPSILEDNDRALRINLLAEEVEEYLDAEEQSSLEDIADALADMMYIIIGTAISYGIPLESIWKEVHTSNMAKLVDGKVIRREDGKILKPSDWTPPNIKKIIEEASNG